MFLRWKKYATKPPRSRWATNYGEYSLAAVLVESRRVNGKPRQKVIKHLASIREYGLADEMVGWHTGFWRDVEESLRDLDLSEADRAKIEAALVRRVPKPTKEKWAAANAKFAEEMKRVPAS